jgi:hypothetical protein
MRQLVLLTASLAVAAGQSNVGRLDTIGGTTYDRWAGANVHRSLVNSPQYGIHAAWMHSTATSGTDFPDRSMRYNFYDYSTHTWNWTDPDYMQSGLNVFSERTGYGVIDADSAGRVIVAANTDSGLIIARDEGAGSGVFEYSESFLGYYWPDMVIGDDGTYHVAMSSGDGLSYTRFRTSSEWDSVRTLDSLAFPTYAIAASRTEPSVCATWVGDTGAFYLLSENRGDTWSSRIRLDPPPAFGGDTVTRFSMHGLFPFFDSQGRLHIAAAVYPEVHDTAYVNIAELWHWCPANQPHWAGIHSAGCAPGHLQASVGYNAIYADRPTLGEGPEGALYVAWEQFDSSNVEPTTSRLRAGIWLTASGNNGLSWGPGTLVTERNTSSHRFPCIVDPMIAGGQHWTDTMCVLYLRDSVAGFFVQGEGPATFNPVICQFVPVQIWGVAERPTPSATSSLPMASVVRGVLDLGVGDRQNAGYRAKLLDAVGRKVLGLRPGANDVSRLSPGVYFVREGGESREQGRAGVRRVVIAK